MNDLYCKDFEFLNKDNQKAYDNLKRTILKRSRLDLEFLQRFIQFSRDCLGTVQFECAKYGWVYAKDNSTLNFTDFCSLYLGLSPSTISKLYTTYERFVIESFDVEKSTKKTFSWLLPEFNGMPLSKVFELLSVSIDDLSHAFDCGELSQHMTVKQLRAWVKNFKGVKTSNKVDEAIDKDDDIEEESEEQPIDYSQCRKTYDKIISYIDFFKSTQENDPAQLKKLFVTDLHSIKNALIKEFGLEIDK